MPQWASFAVFFSIVSSIYGTAHYYLYSWFVRLAEPSKKVRSLLRLFFIFLVASLPTAKFLGWYDFNVFSYLLALMASVWMGLVLYLFLFALGCDLLIALFKKFFSGPKVSSRRSLFNRRLLLAGIGGCVLMIGGLAVKEARDLQVTRLEVSLRGLPPELDGFSLVQVSDVHYGMLTENGRLSLIISRINELQPDVVVITGDLVDEGVSHMEEMSVPLSRLKSRQGIFAVTGNHEYYAGVDRAIAIMKGARIRVLRNEVAILNGGLQMVGIDDPTGSRRVGNPAPDFEKILARLDPQKPSILLYHQPIKFEEVASAGVDLQLSGHTHGGQLFPVRYISQMIYPRTPGLHQIGKSYLYVSRGAGTWGPPMRLLSPPELVYIRLRSQKTK
ncbi:MAG: metallophosphoesterase [Deltaproteobacteria bacterium]|nr:metallophosphoesterase [Deltaproteobacteria bacterium]